MNRLKGLIHEIHRRSLWQVLGIYVVGSWLAIQVVQTLTESLGMPLWFPQFAVILLIVGFPIVMATAFVQEGLVSKPEPQGSSRAERIGQEDDAVAQSARSLFTWRNAIGGGVLAFASWGVVAAGWLLLGRSDDADSPADDLPFVAVLPCGSTSADEESHMFAAGVHDDLLTQLSKVRSLRVISRTSMERFRDTEESIPAIAAQLGADVIMECSVQRVGPQIRVNTQLVDGVTDEHLWAESYNRAFTVDQLLDLQADIAGRVATALHTTLSPEDADQIREATTSDHEAYRLYLQAMALKDRMEQRGPAVRSVALLEEAVARDAGFVAAWAELARAISVSIRFEYLSGDSWARATSAVERTRSLDPDGYDTHMAAGFVVYHRDRDLEGAEIEFRAANEIRPGAFDPPFWLGVIAKRQGHWEESVELYDRAAEVNPLFAAVWDERRYGLLALRRYGEALETVERGVAVGDDSYLDRRFAMLMVLGDSGAARRQWVDVQTRTPGRFPHWQFVLDHYLQREFEAAAESVRAHPVPFFGDTWFLTRLDGPDDVAMLLQRAGRAAEAKTLADSAATALREEIGSASPFRRPDVKLNLAGALAVLGEARASHVALQEALADGERLDPFAAAFTRSSFAPVYLTAGDTARALDELEWCLGNYPAYWSPEKLQLDPWWDPLRDHPRFQALLERYEGSEREP